MADLEQNFMQLQLMHESLARFSESFAGFLYGMNMNAFCVDFPEVCLLRASRRALARLPIANALHRRPLPNLSRDHRTTLISVAPT
jgi:hypothetical protein